MNSKQKGAEEKSLVRAEPVGSSKLDKTLLPDSVQRMLAQRQQMMMQLKLYDEKLFEQLRKSAENSYQPLSQASIKQMMEQNIGSLKVAELCMVSELAPATYYNALSKVETVKVGSIQRLLNAVGLELFIGKKITEPVKRDTHE